MSDVSQGPGWWRASDGKWYPPETHPDYQPPAAPPAPPAPVAAPHATPVAGSRQPTVVGGAPPMVVSGGPGIGEPLAQPQASSGGGVPRWLPLAGVALVVGVGLWFLFSSVLGGGSAAGASSPESALDEMVAALDAEDGLGLVSIVDLEDFGLVSAAVEDSAGGTLSEGLPGGIDLAVTGLDGGPVTATFRDLGGPESGLQVAEIDGMEITLTRTEGAGAGVVTFDPASMAVFSTAEIDEGSELVVTVTPRGRDFEIEADGRINGERIGTDDPVSSEGLPLEMVFIENDGRWFFSLGYTIANLAVEVGAVDDPDWGRWRAVLADETSGGDTPVEAVTRIVEALPTLDLEDAMAAVDPVETKLLHDFLPLILDAIDDPRADALAESEVEVVALELSEEIDGDVADVFIDRIAIRATDDFGDSTLLELDGDWCYVVEDDFDRTTGCLDDDLAEIQREFDDQIRNNGLDVDIDLRDLLAERPFVRARQRQGNWYMSPLDTLFAYSATAETALGETVGQLQAQLGTDTGVILADGLRSGETMTLEVPAGGVAALAIGFDGDDFVELDEFSQIAPAAVTFEATGRVELQHTVDGFGSDETNTLRLRDGQAEQLLVISESRFPRTQAVLFRNEGADPVEVTVTMQAMPVLQVGERDRESGVIDDNGTPWLVVLDTSDGDIDGADGIPLEFDRFPWFEPGRPETEFFGGLVFVFGEPGDEFTVDG